MMRRRRPLLPLVALLVAAPAFADEPPAPAAPPAPAEDASGPLARAREVKKSGDRAMDALRFADAYAAYSDVFAITRDAALLYNMGRALQALNRFPEALDRLEAFQAVAPAELKARVPGLDALIKDLRGRVATLRVSANVEGARLLVRQAVASRLPRADALRLSSGPAEIEVEAEGYFPFRTTVDLPGGGEATVEAKLHSRATSGLLTVRASAAGALVFVDGARQGFAPVELHLPGGTHRVAIKHPDHRDHETTVAVVNGQKKDIDVRLLPPLVVTRWWFWGSIALAGATAGVVGYALTTERAPGAGSIAPGKVAVPEGWKGVTVLSF